MADAKPAAQIVWFRNNLELKSGNFCLNGALIFFFVLFLPSKILYSVNVNAKRMSFSQWTHTRYAARSNCMLENLIIRLIIVSRLDRRDDKVIETRKRFTTTSRLQLTPTHEEDYAEYTCQAKHKALQPDMPMRVTVQLSVLCKYFIQFWVV